MRQLPEFKSSPSQSALGLQLTTSPLSFFTSSCVSGSQVVTAKVCGKGRAPACDLATYIKPASVKTTARAITSFMVNCFIFASKDIVIANSTRESVEKSKHAGRISWLKNRYYGYASL